jgi:HSP20 family protein
MTESDRNRRRSGGLFGDFAELLKKLAELGETNSGGREFELPGGARGVYGFSVTTAQGPNTKPAVKQFGNVKMTHEGAVVSETREPLVDVFDEGDEVVLVAELPGVKDTDIELTIRGDMVELTAHGHVQKYHCETLLPTDVNPEPVSRQCENGYLQLRLAKATKSSSGDSNTDGGSYAGE